jgi:hypothetical protein
VRSGDELRIIDELEPTLRFVGLFGDNADPGREFDVGSGATRAAIVERDASCGPRQLMAVG